MTVDPGPEMKAKIFNIQKFSLHDGEGIRTTVFFSGCSLRCKWCCNPDGFQAASGREYDVPQLLEAVMTDKVFYRKSGGGVTLSGGEVLLQLDFIAEFCRELRKENINIAVETSGYAETDRFMRLTGLADFIFIDLKHYDGKKHIAGTGVANDLILRNIEALARSGFPFRVRIPVIPGFNDAIADAEAYAQLFRRLGVKDVEPLPFHQFGERKYRELGLSYAYANVPQLHEEDICKYTEILRKNL